MSTGRIHLDAGPAYLPGESVTGRVEGARLLGEVRLFWQTCGRGTDELAVVDVQPVNGDGRFALKLPTSPYSVNGSLVSIEWGIEWVDEQGDALDHVGITMSAHGEVVRLSRIDQPRSQKKKRWWSNQG